MAGAAMRERWLVKLGARNTGGVRVTVYREVTIGEPHGIRRADAEVKAMRELEEEGYRDVRALDASYLGAES